MNFEKDFLWANWKTVLKDLGMTLTWFDNKNADLPKRFY